MSVFDRFRIPGGEDWVYVARTAGPALHFTTRGADKLEAVLRKVGLEVKEV